MRAPSIQGRSICIVDDDDAYRQFLAALLAGGEARVREAPNIAELLSLIQSEAFDCIVLDCDLQNESGLAALTELARFERPPPVVMLTGIDNRQTILRAFRCGASDYVLKRDFRPDELFSAIHRAIARSELEQATRAELTRLKQRRTVNDL